MTSSPCITKADFAKTRARGYWPRKKGKFMVCDHCMSHGLTCNEASVCDQCQLHGMPCFHRFCSKSPHSSDGCGDQNCHYVHLDHLPPYDNELPGYLIYPGKLPIWLSRGRKRNLTRIRDFESWTSHYSGVAQLRAHYDAEMSRWVQRGQGTLETNRVCCGDLCAVGDTDDVRIDPW